MTKILDFSEDEATLCRFVEEVGATGGGDADGGEADLECGVSEVPGDDRRL